MQARTAQSNQAVEFNRKRLLELESKLRVMDEERARLLQAVESVKSTLKQLEQ